MDISFTVLKYEDEVKTLKIFCRITIGVQNRELYNVKSRLELRPSVGLDEYAPNVRYLHIACHTNKKAYF